MLTPGQQIITATGIPPFGYQTWRVGFRPTNFLTNIDAPFTIRFAPDSDLGGRTNENDIKIAPFFLTPWGLGGITLGIFGIVIFIIALKIRRVRLPRS